MYSASSADFEFNERHLRKSWRSLTCLELIRAIGSVFTCEYVREERGIR
jgi:hypothetical protein